MEGPSLIILREELARFKRKKVLRVDGNSQRPKAQLAGKTLRDIVTWGKTIYLVFTGGIVTRTHFMLFGSYRIDDPKPDRTPRLELEFANGTVYFYACAFSMDAGESLKALDHRIDILSTAWDERHVLRLLKDKGNPYLCDLFLDQTLFAGSGNIVKNEVLFNLRRHPLTRLSDIPIRDRKKLVHAVRVYCENFYEWKKRYELRRHWQVYKRWTCRNCGHKLKREQLGAWKRATFHCPRCQHKKLSKLPVVVHEVLPIPAGGAKEKRLDH